MKSGITEKSGKIQQNCFSQQKFSKKVRKNLEIWMYLMKESRMLFFSLNSNFILDSVNNVCLTGNNIFYIFIIYLLSLNLQITKCLTTFI